LTIIGIYGIIESEKFVEYCMFRGGSVMKSTGILPSSSYMYFFITFLPGLLFA